MIVVNLASETNVGTAIDLRKLADKIEKDPRIVVAWAAVAVYANGTAGCVFDGPAELALVGALDSTKQRIMGTWG